LASSRDTSNGPDWKDIQSVLRDLEGDLDCRIEIQMRLVAHQGEKDIRVTVTAHPLFEVNGVQRHSVCLSATLDRPGNGLGVAIIYRLLLALDYEASKKWATRQA
jgi:hypothetical protein